MIAGLEHGDIIDADEVELLQELVLSLAWIVDFCDEHRDWFGGDNPSDGAENEWLANAKKLLREIDDNGA